LTQILPDEAPALSKIVVISTLCAAQQCLTEPGIARLEWIFSADPPIKRAKMLRRRMKLHQATETSSGPSLINCALHNRAPGSNSVPKHKCFRRPLTLR
jgi:hypothetical protein